LIERLRRFCASGHHELWADTISLRDATVFDAAFIGGHRQLTDVYLLGLAVKRGGRLATLDRTIPIKAVRGARRETLALVAP
jgi:predicted nucleic acid-binding protein